MADVHHTIRLSGNLDPWAFDIEVVVEVACDVGYLVTNFGRPQPLHFRLRVDNNNYEINQ